MELTFFSWKLKLHLPTLLEHPSLWCLKYHWHSFSILVWNYSQFLSYNIHLVQDIWTLIKVVEFSLLLLYSYWASVPSGNWEGRNRNSNWGILPSCHLSLLYCWHRVETYFFLIQLFVLNIFKSVLFVLCLYFWDLSFLRLFLKVLVVPLSFLGVHFWGFFF